MQSKGDFPKGTLFRCMACRFFTAGQTDKIIRNFQSPEENKNNKLLGRKISSS
jgi:hypothetical protein